MQYETITDGKTPVTILLKGPPGSGKTTKAVQFPSPVLFSFDNNLSSLRRLTPEQRSVIKIVQPRMDNGKVVQPQFIWGNFIKQLALVTADDSVKTIVIDSLTTLSEILMDKILGTGDPARKVEIQHWGEFSRYMKWLGEELLCASDLDKHVIVTAHERIIEDAATKSQRYVLNMGGSMKDSFDLFFTDCWRTWVKPVGTDKVVYWVRTLPTNYHNAKSSLDVPADFIWDTQKTKIFAQL